MVRESRRESGRIDIGISVISQLCAPLYGGSGDRCGRGSIKKRSRRNPSLQCLARGLYIKRSRLKRTHFASQRSVSRRSRGTIRAGECCPTTGRRAFGPGGKSGKGVPSGRIDNLACCVSRCNFDRGVIHVGSEKCRDTGWIECSVQSSDQNCMTR